IRVDDGVYNLSTNVVLTAALAGVKFEGYHDAAFPTRRALLNRGNTAAGSYAIEFRGARDLTLDYLHITGAQYGVYASGSSNSLRVTISNSTIYGNRDNGVSVASSNNFVTVANNRVYGVPGGPTDDDQQYGIAVAGADAAVTGNTVFDHYYAGI